MNEKAIHEYCKQDVEMTYKLWYKLKPKSWWQRIITWLKEIYDNIRNSKTKSPNVQKEEQFRSEGLR